MSFRCCRLTILAVWLLIPSLGVAQSEIVRIEEDWELVVASPDEQRDAPQITVSMAPFSQCPTTHLQVNFNYGLKPDFASGGIQLRIQNNDETVAHLHRKAGHQLSHNSEEIKWTSVVQKIETGYAFGIINGSSISWGTFGGANYFLTVASQLSSGGLNGYTPATSTENTGATYAGNRISSLKFKRFRVFDNQGQVAEYQVNAEVE